MDVLFARFPALRHRLPVVRLTELPTPVQRGDSLGQALNLTSLIIKRDDQSASLYGGNKVRKLELVIADVLAKGCDTLVTFGGAGSNHALATAIYGIAAGLDVVAVLTDQPPTPAVAATLRYHALIGTRLVHAKDYQGVLAAFDNIAAQHPGGPERCYKLTWGGSSPLGVIGFVAAGLELAEQLPGDQMPDVIYAACGTMGTVAGLAMGLRLAGLATRVEAVQVTPPVICSNEACINLFNAANRLLHELDANVPLLDDPLKNLHLRDDFYGGEYANVTPAALEAVALMKDTEKLKLETTYTGKALAALVHDARAGELAGQSIMFWNTYNSQRYPDTVGEVTADRLPASLQHYLDASSS